MLTAATLDLMLRKETHTNAQDTRHMLLDLYRVRVMQILD